MAVAIDAQVSASASPGKLARIEMRIAAALGQKTPAGQALDLGEDLKLFVRVDETAQRGWLVIGGGQQANKTAIGNLGLPHAPPRRASR